MFQGELGCSIMCVSVRSLRHKQLDFVLSLRTGRPGAHGLTHEGSSAALLSVLGLLDLVVPQGGPLRLAAVDMGRGTGDPALT